MIEITLAWNLRTDWKARPLLIRAARHAAMAEGFGTGGLSLAVMGKRAMRSLHRRFMNIDQPTDVLTFDLGTDPDEGTIDGEIVVCADVARQRARRASGRSIIAAAREELALYIVHGVLHLAGYDDHDPADFARMHKREDELLEQLGLGRVFSDRSA